MLEIEYANTPNSAIQATDLDAGSSSVYSFAAANTTYIVKSGVVVISNFSILYDKTRPS